MKPEKISSEALGWWIVTDGRQIWLPTGQLPYGSAEQFGLVGDSARQIGEWGGAPCWMIIKSQPQHMHSLRTLLREEPLFFQLVGRGVQLAEFYRSHQWCGYCGEPMDHSTTEFACLCSTCHERYYPQIAPSIIVAIRRGTEILLAQHVRQQHPIHTVLAGFVEAGETLEQTVHREVYEESKLCVTNIRYVSSQPWPFPHSLMIAFMADYLSGEVQPDPSELLNAGWYRYDQLPGNLPGYNTVARRLIEDTVALCRREDNSDTLGVD